MVDDAVPVEVDEEETTPVPVQTMEELVFGDGSDDGERGPSVDWAGQCDDFMRGTP